MKVVVLANDNLQTKIEFQNPIDRRMAHNTMSPNYRYGTEVLEKEGAVYDIQTTHETQGHPKQPAWRVRRPAFKPLE